jgi:hypothetical protein
MEEPTVQFSDEDLVDNFPPMDDGNGGLFPAWTVSEQGRQCFLAALYSRESASSKFIYFSNRELCFCF